MTDTDAGPDRLRRELVRLADSLSEYEAGQLLRLVRGVAVGERYWEGEISALYNERVKTRCLHGDASTSMVIPAAPETEQGVFAPVPIVKSYPGAPRVALLPPTPLEAGLGGVLGRRRSRRDYAATALTLQQASTLIHYSCGVTGRTSGYGYAQLPQRTFPSCGGLQVPEVYLSVQHVDGVPAGLYHYHSIDHALERLRSGDFGTYLRDASLGQPQLETAAIVVLVTGCFDRLRWKYGERGYRYMCIDVGYLGQNLTLVGEAMGLGVCAIAGFMDDTIEQFLAVDGRNEIALLLTTVGVPAALPGVTTRPSVTPTEP
jgi:SagB-type dehydrogenase family enzyme